MENNEHTLEFNLEEYLLMGISIHQLDDGETIHHFLANVVCLFGILYTLCVQIQIENAHLSRSL